MMHKLNQAMIMTGKLSFSGQENGQEARVMVRSKVTFLIIFNI